MVLSKRFDSTSPGPPIDGAQIPMVSPFYKSFGYFILVLPHSNRLIIYPIISFNLSDNNNLAEISTASDSQEVLFMI
jgi:hypothetical protein